MTWVLNSRIRVPSRTSRSLYFSYTLYSAQTSVPKISDSSFQQSPSHSSGFQKRIIWKKGPRMARSLQRPGGSSTETLILNPQDPSSSSFSSSSNQLHQPSQTLVLHLKRAKKKVSWKEGTVDNEFLNRKSSKKCCIFHKEKPFDEDDSDDDGDASGHGDHKENGAGSSGCCSHLSS